MENKQKNSRKRLNSLILLVAFTAVMLIVSTYAWFSAQKNVTISNLEGKVNVAEGLMVSLDAESWSQEVDFEDYDTTTTGVAQYGTSLAKIYEDTTNGLYIRNNVPTELVPVSTTGTEYAAWAVSEDKATGTGSQEIKFYNGINVEGTEFHSMAQTDFAETDPTEVAYPGYFAIDLFLQNSSKIDTDGANDTAGDADDEVQGTTKETLQLNTNSLLQLVTGGSELTGLQNTARVALAMYAPDSSASKTSADTSTVTSSVYVTANQSQILNAYKNATISDVAIWEPNASSHVDTIVNTNNRIRLTPDSILDTNYIAAEADAKNNDNNEENDNIAEFTATEMLPTFALTASSLTANDALTDATKTGIKDIYNWVTEDDDTAVTADNYGLKRQIALQTEKSQYDYTTISDGVRDLVSVTSSGAAIYEMGTETGAVKFQMLKNTIVKCRLYIWLEGQDVDCINFASHGSGVHLDLGLIKSQTVGSGAAAS